MTVGSAMGRTAARGIAAGLVLSLLLGQAAWAERRRLDEELRVHGFVLDGKNRLHIQQNDGVATIYLLSQDRGAGGPEIRFDPESGEEESIIRQGVLKPLARVKAEVSIPAPPNYIQNPGDRYRVTVEGIEIAPEYSRIFEVSASDALIAIGDEFVQLYSRAEGVERDALYYGMILATRALAKAGHLPAELPTTLLRSKVGRFRIQGPTMRREKQPRVGRFEAVAAGQGFRRVMEEDEEISEAIPQLRAVEEFERSGPEERQRATLYKEDAYRFPNREERMEDLRADQVRSLGSPSPARNRLGTAQKALTVPELELPAVSSAQVETMDLLLGDVKSPMEMRMEREGAEMTRPGARRPSDGASTR